MRVARRALCFSNSNPEKPATPEARRGPSPDLAQQLSFSLSESAGPLCSLPHPSLFSSPRALSAFICSASPILRNSRLLRPSASFSLALLSRALPSRLDLPARLFFALASSTLSGLKGSPFTGLLSRFCFDPIARLLIDLFDSHYVGRLSR